MKNILVPLGLSETSITIKRLQYVIDLASELGGTVYAVEVFKPQSRIGNNAQGEDTLRDITQSSIEEVLSKVVQKGVKVEALPLEGELFEAISDFNLKHSIDLIVLGTEGTDIQNPYFLGETSGGLVKKTELPVLIVPNNYVFKPISNILMAVKSGIIKKKSALTPIKEILSTFGSELKLLQVKTPGYLPEDSEFQKDLGEIISSYKSTENATVFQGVLEHLSEYDPGLICVFRRKRGFFTRLWEENAILKKDFESRVPLLVLRGASI